MCCTVGAGTKAELTDTRLYVGEATKDDKYVHVLAYQNNAKTNGPNAMILPFPTNVPMGPLNAIKTSGMKGFLNDIVEATKIPTKSMRSFSYAAVAGMSDSLAQVFDVGSYTVVLADKVTQVPEALKRVATIRRPEVTTQFLLHYGRLYPNQPVALCCWDGTIKDIEPLLWWYEPKNPDELFIPTMDAHDGGPPDLNATVDTDHFITVGSRIQSNGHEVSYSDFLPADALALLPLKAHGHQVPYKIQNGDSFVSVAQLRGSSRDNVIIKRGANSNTIHSENRMRGW
jgi:hypothetical protein